MGERIRLAVARIDGLLADCGSPSCYRCATLRHVRALLIGGGGCC